MRASNKKTDKKTSAQKSGMARCVVKLMFVIAFLTVIYFGVSYALSLKHYTLFPVKDVVFSGNKHLTDNELKAMMGFKGEEGLIGLSGKEFSARLLKSPWVKAVSFRKDFPNRFLIRVEEAMPYALLEMNGRTFFIDDEGNLLEEIKGGSIPFLPVVSGDPFNNHASFTEALNIIRAVKAKGFTNIKDRIEVILPQGSGTENLSMQIDGTLVKIGYGEYEEKLERLIELEDEIVKRGIPVDYIDLRFANRVIVKPVKEVVR
ncbi:MAG: FtsQ-type POTRA domain-containing protein [Nitrospirae bacterium]|nr:FtsQ-type POTRA domain-containing protein [Nitrospirota bacterium]